MARLLCFLGTTDYQEAIYRLDEKVSPPQRLFIFALCAFLPNKELVVLCAA